VCRQAWTLGVTMVEVPIRGEGDLALLAAAVVAGRAEHHVVGAGTVTSLELVRQVADLGAAFTVAPGLHERVAEASMSLGLDHLPGAATATEIQRALALGLRWQKAFPATVLGPGWFAAMRAPFPMARFVATGGITTANARSYLAPAPPPSPSAAPSPIPPTTKSAPWSSTARNVDRSMWQQPESADQDRLVPGAG